MKLRRVIGEKGEALTKQCGNKAKLAVVNPGVFQFRKQNQKKKKNLNAQQSKPETQRGATRTEKMGSSLSHTQ